MSLDYYVVDAETYWAKDYTLKSMTSEAYIRDPRFKDHGWGILPVGGAPMWLSPAELRAWITTIDWSRTALICHNTRFDGAILGWRYGVRPRLWVDTMGLYRALYPSLKRYALAALGKHFGFGEKGLEVDNTQGKRILTSAEYISLGNYCALGHDSDCRITERLFVHAWHRFPAFERVIMDMTLRMFIEPVLRIDEQVLKDFLVEHRASKVSLLEQCGLDKKSVMSSDKFAAALLALGVEPPMKASPSNPEKRIFAFAKTDEAMTELAEHEDPAVQTLVAARLGNKSTLLETRAEHLIEISQRGSLPVPLNYWGAKLTGRHSGGDKLNLTNLTRGSVLRDAITAPPGMMIVVGDSANVELRVMMALAGQWDVMEKIKYYDSIPEKEQTTDLYCDFASDVYGRAITKKDKAERDGVGKTGMLSLQYMTGPPKLQTMLRLKKAPQPLDECERIVGLYRRKMNRVKALWYYCGDTVIPAIADGTVGVPLDVNGWFMTNQGGFSLPGEIGVQYPELQQGEDNWKFNSGRGWLDLFGAKVAQHACQYAARQVVMYQGLLVGTRYRIVHSVYDELVSCVPESEAEACAAFMSECLAIAPPWTQGKLPLRGSVGIGRSYNDAK